MRFSFKIQQYQADAADRVFQGKPYNAGMLYLRDMGSLSAKKYWDCSAEERKNK